MINCDILNPMLIDKERKSMYLNKKDFESKNILEEKHILTVKQLADYCQISEITVRRALTSGELPGLKFGNTWRIKGEQAQQWINSKIKK